MSLLLSCQEISKSYGPRPLFDGVSMGLSKGERLGLIGPNGSGKSTLIKILSGHETPDAGKVTRRKGVRVGYVPQHDAFPKAATPLSFVADALREAGVRHHDDHDAHERENRATQMLSRVGFTRFDQQVSELSGGWRKRLAIARELVGEPDLLMLDEPTNHLDLEGILWLEDLIDDARCGIVVVTHDRYFLEEVTTRIVELNAVYPDGLFSVEGSYSEFLVSRAEFLEAQASQEANLAARVRQDVAWLLRGARARRTKAKGRIDESHQRIGELADLKRRNTSARTAGIDFTATGRKTRNLLVAKGLAMSLGGRTLFSALDLTLMPGTCLGLLGPNGSGKTTLIKVLTGELKPDAGTVQPATTLRVATLSQSRTELDRRQRLRKALCPDGDTVIYNGEGIHVSSWARKFLFRADQLDVAVGELSGGEQARILIAELMRQPADLLILDEPTNDLDISSLEVLEESLKEFPGAVLLVTHDRFMLDRLSTQVLGLDGMGGAKLLAGVSQWLESQAAAAESERPAASKPPTAVPASAIKKGRLSYNEQRDWGLIEAQIQAAEAQAQELEQQMKRPDMLADHKGLGDLAHKLAVVHAEVATLYERWAQLEAKQGGTG